MSSRFTTIDAAALAALAGTAGITAAVYDRLPATIATHFDVHGQANGWMPRAAGAWVLPIVGAALWALLRYLPRVMPRAWRARAEGSPLASAALMTVLFLCFVHLLLVDGALHGGTRVSRAMPCALGALFLGFSQILPRLRRNPVIGIRTAWTLTSDENWLRTHRLGGYTFFVAGVVSLAAGAFAGAQAIALSVAAVITAALVPVAYSYYLARTLRPGD